MGYVIAAILVLLVVAGGVTFFVLKAARGQRDSAARIVAPDESTPVGDTDQHADDRLREGGGTATSGSRPPAGEGGVGGEAEGGRPVVPADPQR